jgi:hypothetical protein
MNTAPARPLSRRRSLVSRTALVLRQLVDLTRIPDPALVSQPALHPGDLGLGDPYWVMCGSRY